VYVSKQQILLTKSKLNARSEYTWRQTLKQPKERTAKLQLGMLWTTQCARITKQTGIRTSHSKHWTRTYLSKMRRVSQHVHIQQLCHISASVCVIFLSEGWPDSSTFLLDHLTLFRLGSCCPDGPDQLPQSDGGWHPLGEERDL